jgi:hypothetical protein
VALCLPLLLAACQLPAPVPVPGAVPVSAELPPLPPLPVEGSVHYVVDGEASDVRIVVYKGGPLANVGHNHVMRVHSLTGDIYIAPEFHRSAFALAFPVAALEVDPADARADEGTGFAVMPSPQAIEATYRNMTGAEVLDAGNHAQVTLRSVNVIGPSWGPEAAVRVTLHGLTRDLPVPLALHQDGGDLIVTGTWTVRPPDFGVKQFTVLGGGLFVQDEIKVRFRIVARYAPAEGQQ